VKKTLQYNIIFRPEPEGGFTAIAPSLPGCVSYGRTLEEAKKMIVDAIKGYLVVLKKNKGKVVSDDNNFISLISLSENKIGTYA